MRKSVIFFLSMTLCIVLMFNAVTKPANAQTTLIVWTKFNDQNPQNTQDKWLAQMIADYEAETGVKIVNTFQPFDQINAKLNVAVQANGDVPDLSYVDSQQLGFFEQNGTLMDLTEWAKSRPWFADVDPSAMPPAPPQAARFSAFHPILRFTSFTIGKTFTQRVFQRQPMTC